MERRNVLKFLAGLGATLTPSWARAVDHNLESLCKNMEHHIPWFPLNYRADAQFKSYLEREKKQPVDVLSNMPDELKQVMKKDCFTCENVIDKQRTELVWYNDGNLPLLITVPHGGTETVLEVPPRANRAEAENFSIYGAIYTYEIAWIIRYLLEDIFGKRPFMIANLAHRRYVDVNRDRTNGYVMGKSQYPDDMKFTMGNVRQRYWKSGAPIFFEYHCVMQRYLNSLYNRFDGKALIIEITGGSNFPNQITRNTLEGKSVQRLRLQKGDDPLIGQNSLLGKIANRGYEVDPLGLPYAPDSCYEEHKDTPDACRIEPLNSGGDYTLQQYGSQNPRGIDAIQLNIGQDLRTTRNYERTGRDLGNAIAEFLEQNYEL